MARTFVFSLLLLVSTAASAAAQGTNWCASIDKAQVNALLGASVATPQASGPVKDDDAGGMMTMCMFGVAQKAIIAIRVEFASPAEALKKVNIEWMRNQTGGDGAKYTEEKGAADKTFWAVSDEGASYVVLKGAKVYCIGLGGQGNNAVAQKAALLKLTESLIGS